MAQNELQVESGDWFVHAHFGAGCVKGQEVKCVEGQEQTYYEIETAVCTLWLPAEQLESQKVRPLANHEEFQEVIEVLREPSEGMDAEANKRKLRIKKVRTANVPQDTAGLVRDLWVRQRTEGKLYDWERQAWRDLCTILIQEWVLSLDVSVEEARQQMDRILNSEQIGPAEDEAANNRSMFNATTTDEEKWTTWLTEAIG